jgi:hypothetical protein
MAAALLSVCDGRTKACVFRLDKDGYIVNSDVWDIIQTVRPLITSGQTRAARAMIGIDQRQLTALSGRSTPAIQRMEASDGVVRGTADSLMKLVNAIEAAGLELVAEGAAGTKGGLGVSLMTPVPQLRRARPSRSTRRA